jgi:hypothetical protein
VKEKGKSSSNRPPIVNILKNYRWEYPDTSPEYLTHPEYPDICLEYPAPSGTEQKQHEGS